MKTKENNAWKKTHIFPTPPPEKTAEIRDFLKTSTFKDSDFETEKIFVYFMKTYGTDAAAEVLKAVKG